jgi:hypothetical protein
MKKILLALLIAFPMIGFGQETKTYFSEPVSYTYKTMQMKSNPSTVLDGVTMIKGSVIFTDTLITIMTDQKKYPKIDETKKEINCYIYDITNLENLSVVSFKLIKKLTDYQHRIKFYNTNPKSSLVIESKDEFSGNTTTVTYILE